jgi:hypothetical protein
LRFFTTQKRVRSTTAGKKLFCTMRRVGAALLLFVLLMQMGGSYVYFGLRLVAIRHEARAALARLPDTALTRFDFLKTDFERRRVEDHELEIDGKMYDIARLVRVGDGVSVWALHDTAEDNLLSFLSAVVQRHRADKKTVPVLVTSVVAAVYDLPAVFILLRAPQAFIRSATPYTHVLALRTERPATPPPWIA